MPSRLWTLLSFSTLFIASLHAQTTGELRGTIKDPAGLVIRGAEVTATLAGAGVTRRGTTDEKGDFVLPTVPVGAYSVEVQAPGFKTYIQQNVEVTLGHVIQVNATLELGATTQTVTAEAEAALVETTSTQMGAVINSTSVVGLPLNTRDTYQLLQLQPGVQSQQGYDLFAGSEKPESVSVNGGRGRANNYNVNGGDANDQFIDVPAIQPSPDTIEEFRVLTNTFDAEYGRNSGSVVNVVTKGGTNSFHGDAVRVLPQQALNTRGFFDTVKPEVQPEPVRRNARRPHHQEPHFLLRQRRRARRSARASPSDQRDRPEHRRTQRRLLRRRSVLRYAHRPMSPTC